MKQKQVTQPQAQEAEVATAIELLYKGFTDTDENILKSITADNLVYGHSSGKVQNKSEFIQEIISGQPLVYLSIELSDQTIQITGDVAVVRHIFMSQTKDISGEPGSLKIGVMQIWQLHDGTWKLLAQQAYKIQ
jgi:ketosteroid isomerase-like protein